MLIAALGYSPGTCRACRAVVWAAGIACSLTLTATGVHAATNLPAATDQLEEIVVTAQKREENLQVVPVSVTALTATALERSGVTNTQDLGMVVPGLVGASGPDAFSPSLRGVGSSDLVITNENAVAAYIDGVYVGSPTSAQFSLSNIKQIEVLKGPQGTLFGRNALGGLINVTTATPTDTFGGKLSVGYGNYDTREFTGYVTGGIVNNLAADLAAYWSDQGEGWGRNQLTGNEAYRSRDMAFRSKWYLTLADTTNLTLIGNYSRQNSDRATLFHALPGTSPLPLPPAPPACGGAGVGGYGSQWFDVCTNADGDSHHSTGGGSLRIEHEFGAAKLLSITGYERTLDTFQIDEDGTYLPLVGVDLRGYERQLTQELQLQSTGSSKLIWTVGSFYMDRAAGVDPQQVSGLAITTSALASLIPGTTYTQITSREDTTSMAGFAQATYPVLDKTNLTLGARYTSDRQDFKGISVAGPSGTQLANSRATKTYPKATYRAAIDHSFGPVLNADDLMGYVSYDRGFKSGTFNAAAVNGSSAAPEVIDAVETGLKSDWFSRRLRINASTFYYKERDVQVLFVQSGIASVLNAASARVLGADVDINAVPVENLNLQAGVEFLPTAGYGAFGPCPNPLGLAAGPVVPVPGTGTTNCDDSRLPQAPRWNGTLGANYQLPLGKLGSVSFDASYHYSTKYYYEGDFHYGIGPAAQAPYGTVNAQLTWSDASDALSLALWGRNLTDRQYTVYGQNTTGFGALPTPGAPRTFGLRAGYRF